MKATVGRIWEAASVDDSRPALQHVWFDADAATLTAGQVIIAGIVGAALFVVVVFLLVKFVTS